MIALIAVFGCFVALMGSAVTIELPPGTSLQDAFDRVAAHRAAVPDDTLVEVVFAPGEAPLTRAAVLTPAADGSRSAFPGKHDARIYCGEFSACGWAPGADRWMSDVIDIMEEYGWDWTFHAFREADMWSVERSYAGSVGDVKAVPSLDNPRMRVLKNGFKRGVK